MSQSTHPVQEISREFRNSFYSYYKEFVNRSTGENHQVLLQNIIKETVDLQSNYVFKMAEQISKLADKEIEEELMKKKQITLANHALDEVKFYLQAIMMFVKEIYSEYVE